MKLKPIQHTFEKKYNFHCPKFLEQHQYTSSDILDSYNLFGQEERNDEHVLRTPKFLSSNMQDSCLKNIPYRLTPFLKKLGKYYKFFTITYFLKKITTYNNAYISLIYYIIFFCSFFLFRLF